MAGRAFCVKIQLDVHAVTCPGVWLCPNGKVALRINALNSCAETRGICPIFPLLYHDRFTFDKIFARIASLAELQRTLEREFLYAELIQRITPAGGRAIALATFEINLADLLYPAPCFKGLLAGVDVDLLMEPTKSFPGIIAPKIEVSTKTVVEEVLGFCDTSTSKCYVINPKMIDSKQTACGQRRRPIKGIIRQRKVCHTKPRSQSCRPYRQRSSSVGDSYRCSSCTVNHRTGTQIDQYCHTTRRDPTYAPRACLQKPAICDNIHAMDSCPVCSKYNGYFSKCYEDLDAVRKYLDVKQRHNDAVRCQRNLLFDDRREDCCACRSNGAYDAQEEPTISLLQSKVRSLQKTDERLCAARIAADDVVERAPSYVLTRDRTDQGFYKNLEKFYKRMYKQAKIRAQDVEG